MNFQEAPNATLNKFHEVAMESLAKDDANPSPQKAYGVREHKDWRRMVDEIEAEFKKRGIPFTPLIF